MGETAKRFHRRQLLSLMPFVLMALLSLGGMAVSSYLAWGHFSERSLFCGLGHGCDAVEQSDYSVVLGVPVAVWGGLLYLAMLATALGGVCRAWGVREVSSYALFGMSLAGTLYSGYLAWVEVYRIEAVCMWCTISAIIITTVLVTSVVNLALEMGRASKDYIRRGSEQ